MIHSDMKGPTESFTSNESTVKVEKCEALRFDSRKPNNVVVLGNEMSPHESSCEYLGVRLVETS